MKSIELFAGAGGLGMGLHHAGFHPLGVFEWDQYCCDTIHENKKRGIKAVKLWPLFKRDIGRFKFHRFEDKLDLVSGGPPCQPFSLGGKHRANRDTRDMFPAAIRALRETRPRAFVFENVKGLTRASFHNYFHYLCLQMEHPELERRKYENWQNHLMRLERHHTYGRRAGLHYRVVTRVLNAADYGVPQRRERVVFVGFRDDLRIEWSFPEGTHSHDALLWTQARDNSYWDRHGLPSKSRCVSPRAEERARRLDAKPAKAPWLTVRDAIHDLPDPERDVKASAGILNHRFQDGARTYPGHTGSPLDESAKTLKAGVHGVPGGENMLLRQDGSVRYFSVRETARLQTFPDDYLFHGSWTETMRQLGNAVPVGLAQAIGLDIARRLKALA